MNPITIDGHTYTRNDLEGMRQTVIGYRDESLKQWPEAISFTVACTHVIGVLAAVIEQYPN